MIEPKDSHDRRALWRRHPVLAAGLAAMLALTLAFALRLGFVAGYWSGTPPRDPTIEAWMPVGYIARSWDVPREVLAEALGIAPGSSPRQSIGRIAGDQGESAEVLIVRIDAAIRAYRQAAGDE